MAWLLNIAEELSYKLANSHESNGQMAESTERLPNGKFKKGHRRISARVKGTPNRISRSLREGILDAAIEHGSDGHGKDGLKGCAAWLLREHTKAFMPLLVRLLPLQVNGEVSHRTTKLNVNIVSVPRGYFYGADGVLRPGPNARVIEHHAEERTSMVDEPAPHDATPQRCTDDDVVPQQ